MKGMQSLKDVDLAYNQITQLGAALEGCSKLDTLCIDGNLLNEDALMPNAAKAVQMVRVFSLHFSA